MNTSELPPDPRPPEPSPSVSDPGDATLASPAGTGWGTGAPTAVPPDDPDRLAPERVRVSGYEVLGVLGRGGMGVVYRAVQTSLGRVVALKMLLAGEYAGAADLRRFRAEAEAVARLQHPGIVQIYEVGEHQGRAFLALEYCGGGTLEDRLDGTPWTPRPAAELAVVLARAVEAAHRAGVVHRDLKPANVLFTDDGALKITDFGLAKKTGGEGDTQSGAILGTPSYMAPEQAAGKTREIGPAADVYALGAILYELLTGRPPFKAATPLDTILAVTSEEPVPPTRLNPRLPRDLDTICLKCLQKDPGKRYATAAALADDLGRFGRGEPIAARPASALERAWRWCRRRPAVAGLLASVTVLILALLVVSTGAAVWLGAEEAATRHERDRALAAEDSSRRAERDAKDKLVQSYLGRARASRWSGQPGRRFDSLDALAEAARLARELELPDERFRELRNEALACMALPDCRPGRRWPGFPPGTAGVCFTPDLARYLRSDKKGNLSLRRVADDAEVLRLPGNGTACYLHAFSADGRYLAAVRERLEVWDLREEAKPILSTEGGWPAFAPDGRLLAVGRAGQPLVLHELPSGQEARRLPVASGHFTRLAFAPDGRSLAISDAQRLLVVDAGNGGVLASLEHPRGVHSLAWHPHGRIVAAGCDDFRIYVWDVPRRSRLALLEGHEAEVTQVTFSHGGTLLASGSWDGGVRLWDTLTWKEQVRNPAQHGHGFPRLDFRPDDRELAFGSENEQLVLWRVDPALEVRALSAPAATGKGPWGADFRADGRVLASAHDDGARLWDLATGREIALLPVGHTETVLFCPDGSLLTSGSGGVRRWPVRVAAAGTGGEVEVGAPRLLLPLALDGKIGRACWRRPGQSLFVADRPDGAVVVLDVESERVVERLPGHRLMHTLSASPDGRWVALSPWGEDSPHYRILDVAGRRVVREVPVAVGLLPVFSPDGRWLLVPQKDCSFHEVGSWAPGPAVEAEPALGRITAAAYSPDGRLLTLSYTANVVRLLDADTRQELARLPAGGVLQFSADGGKLATHAGHNKLQVWDLRRLRGRLAAMGLDWQPAEKAAPEEEGPAPGPLVLRGAGAVRPEEPAPLVVAPLPAGRRRAATAEQIAGWVRDLGGRRSDEAARSLLEVGPAARPALEEAMRTAEPAARRPLRDLIDRLAVQQALEAPRARLNLENASLERAVAALARQTGLPLECPAGTGHKITLRLDDVPAWEALERLRREGGLTCKLRVIGNGRRFWLEPGKPEKPPLVSHSGPVRMEAVNWFSSRSLDLSGETPPGSALMLNVDTLVGPAGAVVGVGPPRVTSAEDAAGRPLAPAAPASTFFSAPLTPLSYWRHTLHLAAPEQPGGTLKRLRGVVPLMVFVDRRDRAAVDLAALNAGRPVTVPVAGGGRLTVRRDDNASGRTVFTVLVSTRGAWDFDASRWGFDVTAAGRRHRPLSFAAVPLPDERGEPEDLILLGLTPGHLPWGPLAAYAAARGPRSRVVGQLVFPDLPRPTPPGRFVLYSGRRLRTEVPFEFRDVPLP